MLQAAIDFVYPATCVMCQADLAGSPVRGELIQRRAASFCDGCRGALLHDDRDCCRRCGAPVGPNLPTDTGCVHCAGDSFAFAQVMSLGVHDGLLRDAVLAAKQARMPHVAMALADLLIDRRGAELRSAAVDVVTSVPLHWTSRLARPMPSSEVMADGLANALTIPCDPHLLRKVRRTPPQTSLTPTERRNNLRGAFRLSRGVQLHGCRVLLIDDVLTTGTTAHRASQVLLEGGAAEVIVAVVTRGLGPGGGRV